MQLKRKRRGRITRTLGLLTANLLAATVANAQPAPSGDANAPDAAAAHGANANDDTLTDVGLTRIDSAVLFYREAGGRVMATEPVISATVNNSNGDSLSLKLTSDTLTGATPNGATPSRLSQTFITPARPPGTSAVVTSASGGSTIITIPGTGTIARQYVIGPHQLPMDKGFRDQRRAIEAAYGLQWNPVTRLSATVGASTERDYTTYTAGLGLSRDFNQKNTTVSANLALEYDQSRPFFGTPQPLTVMSAAPKGPNASKTETSLLLGVTQVMNRRWLTQLNYTVDSDDGYQTEPYRIISVVDPTTGDPLQYLYESRPKSRLRQSVYWGNKFALGPTVTDFSARYYHDSWGVNSVTAALAERVALTSWVYVEPQARYYSQTAAAFFRNYLVSGQALPTYATSDSRLGNFKAATLALKFGFKIGHTGELYVEGDSYKQTGAAHPAGAIGYLANENLFTGVTASSLMFGYSFTFY